MKISVFNNELQHTLKEIERLAFTYSKDIAGLKNLKLKEFFNYVSKQIKYKSDPAGCELLMRPAVTIKNMAGDCDDKTILCLAYFIENEIPCGYSIVSERPDGEPHHIFPILKINGKLFDFDATYSTNKFLENRTGFTKRIDTLIYEGKQMKTIILEGNRNNDLRSMQYYMSGGLSGEISGLKKSIKKSAKKAIKKVESKATVQVQKVVTKVEEKAKEKLKEQVNELKSKVEDKVKAKLSNLTNIEGLIDAQLKAVAIECDEILNNVPVVGSINRGYTYVTGDNLSEIVIHKAGQKIVCASVDKLKEKTGDIISKYIPNIVDSDVPATQETGYFLKYMAENPSFTTFNKSNEELKNMHPDVMYSMINEVIKENNGEKLILPPEEISADTKKIYYYTAGQPLYNAYNSVLYKQIIGAEKTLTKVKNNPDSINETVNDIQKMNVKSFNPELENENKQKQETAPQISIKQAKQIQADKKNNTTESNISTPLLIGGVLLALYKFTKG